MKVILKQEVKDLGKEWDIVSVADGYARNFLIPRNLAMVATQTSVSDLERRRQRASVKRRQQEEVAKILAAQIEAIPVVITARSGPEGRLYGSVTASDIAEFFGQHKIEIDRRRVEIGDPIRTLGDHHANVELAPGVSAHIRIQVTPEGGQPVGAAPAAATSAPAAATSAPAAATSTAAAPAEGAPIQDAPVEDASAAADAEASA